MMSASENSEKKNLNTQVGSIELLLSLRRRWWFFLPLTIVIFLGSYWYVGRYILYETYINFFVNTPLLQDQNYSDDEVTDVMLRQTVGTNRMNQLVYSTDMIVALDKKLKLYKYFGIDTLDEFHFEKLYDILHSRIDFLRSPNNLITISVRDRDRFMGASIANEIVRQLTLINTTLLISQLEEKVRLVQSHFNNVQAETSRETAKADSVMLELKKVFAGKGNDISQIKLNQMQEYLLRIESNVFAKLDEGLKTFRQYQWNLNTLSNMRTSIVTVVHRAMPDTRSLLVKRVTYASFIMLTIMVGVLILFYQLKKYKEVILLLIKGK